MAQPTAIDQRCAFFAVVHDPRRFAGLRGPPPPDPPVVFGDNEPVDGGHALSDLCGGLAGPGLGSALPRRVDWHNCWLLQRLQSFREYGSAAICPEHASDLW